MPPEQVNGVVNRVPCKDCSKNYIGQSGRSLLCWLKEHRRAAQNGDLMPSAIAKHAWQESHQVDWEAIKILDYCRFKYTRCM